MTLARTNASKSTRWHIAIEISRAYIGAHAACICLFIAVCVSHERVRDKSSRPYTHRLAGRWQANFRKSGSSWNSNTLVSTARQRGATLTCLQAASSFPSPRWAMPCRQGAGASRSSSFASLSAASAGSSESSRLTALSPSGLLRLDVPNPTETPSFACPDCQRVAAWRCCRTAAIRNCENRAVDFSQQRPAACGGG